MREAVDELALAGQEHLDPAYVAAYDRKAGFEADAAEEVELLRRNGLGEDSTLVDLGAGTGTFAIAAARVCRRVVAVDVSPAMIAAAKERVAQRGLTNVECVQAGFLGYEHIGGPADAVYSRNALHHLPDFWKAIALERVSALLRPGGLFRLRDIAFSFDPGDAERFLEEWLGSAAETPEEGWTRDELEAHLRDEHSTFTWLLEPMLDRAGFDVVDADYSASGMDARYLCKRR